MRPFSRINRFLNKLPVHLSLVVLVVLWVIPTLGVFVTSFRTRQAVTDSGWWTVFSRPKLTGEQDYTTYCASCHGAKGDAISQGNLSDPAVVSKYARSVSLLAYLKQGINGQPHLKSPQLPDNPRDAQAILAPVLEYLNVLDGTTSSSGTAKLTLQNYADALVGYKGTANYLSDCKNKVPSTLATFTCNFWKDLRNPGGMAYAFVNTVVVAIPASALPILFAGFAAYAFAWMDFKGRQWLFAILVGLQVVPLQLALVPIARLYTQIGLQDTFLGIWLFHTGFGLPYAIYLMRNFMGSLPREVFESAYIDGANHWTAFWKLAIPLSVPAIASLWIFQFLWIWNDFLVAKIFLTGHPVLTVQITNLIDPRGGNWSILTGAAFLSFIVPMLVFFGLQRFFVRGMLAGSVKG
ncbi:MAG: ABC transporter permease subunit [Anaerolineales bacterium]|jgi:alpha-glucoside transport system permease protein